MGNGISVKMQLPSEADLEQMLNMVPKLQKFKVLDKATTAAAKVVVKRAKELTPRSADTGTSKKRSKKQRNAVGKSGDKINWDYPLWKTIKRVFRKYNDRYGLAVIGPEWPLGNKAYFNTSPKGNVGWLWGKQGQKSMRNGKEYTAPAPRHRAMVRNWIVKAFDETKTQQINAMKDSLTKTVDEVMRG